MSSDTTSKKLELLIAGIILGTLFVDGLHIWATDNYRLYFQSIFILLLFINAAIAWVQYFKGTKVGVDE